MSGFTSIFFVKLNTQFLSSQYLNTVITVIYTVYFNTENTVKLLSNIDMHNISVIIQKNS